MQEYLASFSKYVPMFQQTTSVMKENAIYIILLFILLVYVLKIVNFKIAYNKKKREYLIKKNTTGFISDLTKELRKNKHINAVLESLAIKIGMYTPYSMEKNIEYATQAIIGMFALTIVILVAFMPGKITVWYIGLFIAIIAIGLVGLIIYIFTLMAKMRFTRQLPDTFKILNSRYINTGNILKAINISMGDFDKAIKREMLRIYDVLRKNDMMEIDAVFDRIEKTYKNEHLTLLLNLIKQAHFKGGNETIKQQFEQATEDVLSDIENQRDLTSATRTYILLSLIIPFGIKLIEMFNESSMGEASTKYYESTAGIQFKMAVVVGMIIYIGMMLFLERKG